VHDRQRPADLTAARSGFVVLTRVAHEQCDAWTGLAAAGEAGARVVESIWRTSATAGVVQREIGIATRALGFTYDTGLYLQLHAADREDFQLADAATLSGAGKIESGWGRRCRCGRRAHLGRQRDVSPGPQRTPRRATSHLSARLC
jgi:hypothetical protein